MQRSFSRYDAASVSRARRLRREATFPERLLWSRLRGGQMGVRVLRQHPVGAFVVDFCVPSHRLLVEVDGRTHDGRLEEDSARALFLAQHGYALVRVSNNEVLRDLDGTVARIAAALHRCCSQPPP